mmetsp:Transcript_66567/g.175555  ORF Transcript_66567/g.175555 Transcript_66567/m.175555 type:complete len:243 (-) Transcript_66567:112-840(-)
MWPSLPQLKQPLLPCFLSLPHELSLPHDPPSFSANRAFLAFVHSLQRTFVEGSKPFDLNHSCSVASKVKSCLQSLQQIVLSSSAAGAATGSFLCTLNVVSSSSAAGSLTGAACSLGAASSSVVGSSFSGSSSSVGSSFAAFLASFAAFLASFSAFFAFFSALASAASSAPSTFSATAAFSSFFAFFAALACLRIALLGWKLYWSCSSPSRCTIARADAAFTSSDERFTCLSRFGGLATAACV